MGTRYTRSPQDIVRLTRGNVVQVAHQVQGAVVQATNRGRRRVQRQAPGHFTAAVLGLIHPLLPDLDPTPIKLSVVLGTYNRHALLSRCVRSIRKACKGIQYEIVVCDGGSTDGSVAWLKSQDDVVLIHGDLSGAVKAFNAAARKATGEFIVALNDDAELTTQAMRRALAHFRDPMVGQIAMSFYEHGKWKMESVFGKTYANFAVTRGSIVRTVEKITGGMWSPCYHTYGGDTELSCWVHRLGYRVVAAHDAKVVHHEHVDAMRGRNTTSDRQRRQFWQRWNEEAMTFRGPLPKVTHQEAHKLAHIERGETSRERWPRIAAMDPKPGQAPPRAALKRERVLHWQLWTTDDPQTSMVAGLRKLGSVGHAAVQWPQYSTGDRGRVFLEAMRSLRPTVAFVQCQDPAAVPIDALIDARNDPNRDPSLVICVWSGDVGPGKGPWANTGDDWQYRIAEHVDLMLFTGTGQVKLHRARGMANAAYLQIGYDTDRYHEGPSERYGSKHPLVFMGQDYSRTFDNVPSSEAQLRRDAVAALRSIPGFTAYGSGFGPGMPQHQSGDIYRGSSMAMSISLCSALERYSSDRLLRAMACGCPTLVKRFADMEGMGLDDGHNCLAWDTPAELVDKARTWLSVERAGDLRLVGESGAALMRSRHTWDARMSELAALLSAVRKQAA